MSTEKQPLNIRNNNPGNLRFAGQEGATPGEGGFARFESPEAGLAAMQRQIELDTQKRGMTLDAFINKYAPPNENNTKNYVEFVARRTGLDPRSTVPAEKIPDLQRVMVEMEGGARSRDYFYASATAGAKPAAKPAAQPEPTRVAQAPRTTGLATGELPDNYRMALAANYLADTEEDNVTEKAMELLEASGQGGGGGGSSAGYLAKAFPMSGAKAVDPFQFVLAQPEEEPKRRPVPRMPRTFAEGGEVSDSEKQALERDLLDRQIMAQVRNSALQLMGGGKSDEYGSGFSGRMTYGVPLTRDMLAQIYLEGYGTKDRGMPYQGEITGGGVRLTKNFAEGGEAKKSFGEFLADEAMGPLEAGATLATGALSGMAAPFYGVYKNLTSGKFGTREGTRIAEEEAARLMESGTYMPRSERGQEMLQTVGKALERSKVPPLLPETAALQVAPGAARFLKDRAKDGMDGGAEAFRRTLEASVPQPQMATAMGPMDVPRETIVPQAPQNLAEATLTYAVKPGGGVVETGYLETLYTGNAMNKIMEKYKERTGEDIPSLLTQELIKVPEGENFAAIEQWVQTKGRDYFAKQYGSPNDPLFKLFMEGKFTPSKVLEAEDMDRAMINAEVLRGPEAETRLTMGRRLLTSDNPDDQLQGKKIMSNLYDQATTVMTRMNPDSVRNRLYNPQYRDSIAQNIREQVRGKQIMSNFYDSDQNVRERADLGFDELSQVELDSILDEYAQTGNLPATAPFSEADILEGVAANVIDSEARKIKIQGGVFGNELGQGFRVDEDFKVYSEPGIQNVRRGEPIYVPGYDVSNDFIPRADLTDYMLTTPKEEWQNLTMPEVVLKMEKAGQVSMDPEVIAKRIDNYKPVKREQRLVGTTLALPLQESVLGKGANWREITDVGGIQIEGRLLKHCLSLDPKYASFLKEGLSKFFALRDKDGKSYATIQIDRLGQGEDGPFANVHQIKGFRNAEVGDQYQKEIMDFLTDYEQKVGVPLRYTESRSYLPPQIRDMPPPVSFAKGGMVDKPLYDRAR
jgi:hypothetical protein